MRIQNIAIQYNPTTFRGNIPQKVVQKVSSTPQQITTSVNKSIKSKKGLLGALTAFALAFIGLFKSSKKTTDAKIETPNIAEAPKPIIEKPVELEPTPENFAMLEKKVEEFLIFSREIEYSNIELLQRLPENERKKIVSYLKYHPADAKNFIAFATGEAAGALLCVDSNCHNIFTSLKSEQVDTSNFVWDSGGELLVDKKRAEKIIKDNLEFFKIRLGLPADSTIEDVRQELLCCGYNSPLRNKNKSADLMQLLLGNDIYDACHAQIVKDIRKTGRIFYAGCASNLEEYKATLKKSVLAKNSSYVKMPQSFKDDLIKKIDSIPEEAFRSKVTEPIEFLREPKSELEKFRSLERLVQKLEKAQKYGSIIKYEPTK